MLPCSNFSSFSFALTLTNYVLTLPESGNPDDHVERWSTTVGTALPPGVREHAYPLVQTRPHYKPMTNLTIMTRELIALALWISQNESDAPSTGEVIGNELDPSARGAHG